jgi:polar amino acid transport system substrate-binding protein
MKSLLTSFFALLSVACFAVDKIHVIDVIVLDYPPYSSPTLPSYGSSFSLLSQYANSHFRIKIKPFFVPPARANRLIKDGNWCLSFYPPGENNESARFVPLSNDMVKIGFYRLLKAGRFHWKTLSELRGKIVAVLRSNETGKMHKGFIDSGLQLVYVESVKQGIQLVLKGRVDYAFGDSLALLETELTEAQKKTLQFSESAVHQARIVFFYNIQCADNIFNLIEK